MTEQNTGSHRRLRERMEDAEAVARKRMVGDRPTCQRCGAMLREARDGSQWCEHHGQQDS
jgi:hypothetical protein